MKKKEKKIRLNLWDTAGQEKFDSITSTYYKSTDVAIFVYGIDNKESFNRIPGWIKELEDKNTNNKKEDEEDQKMIKILIANKKDLEDDLEKLTDEKGKINEYKFKELLKMDFGSKTDKKYEGEKI